MYLLFLPYVSQFVSLFTVKQHTLRVTYDDYKDCNLREEDNFRIGCHAFIKEKDFDYFDQDVLKMRKPKLSFMVCCRVFFQ